MGIPQGLCDRVVPPAPDENVAIGVTGQDISSKAKGQASDIFGLVPLVKKAGFSRQSQAGIVQSPEVDVAFATRDNNTDLKRMKFGSNDRFRGTFCLSNFAPAFSPGPVPDGHGVVSAFINGHQKVAAILKKTIFLRI